MSFKEWLIYANRILSTTNIININVKLDCLILLKYVTKINNLKLLKNSNAKLKIKQQKKLNLLINRRKSGEPIAYLVNECEFWSIKLKISVNVMIPRIETECLVAQALNLFPFDNNKHILDLGTGSGAIALALASERKKWKILGIDCQSKAIFIANYNANLLKLRNVVFLKSYWFKNLSKKKYYDLIISNPPYISSNDLHFLNKDINFEPKISLLSGLDGLKDIKKICEQSIFYLKIGGWLLLEHGFKQGNIVRNLLHKNGFTNINSKRDLNKNERISYGQYLL